MGYGYDWLNNFDFSNGGYNFGSSIPTPSSGYSAGSSGYSGYGSTLPYNFDLSNIQGFPDYQNLLSSLQTPNLGYSGGSGTSTGSGSGSGSLSSMLGALGTGAGNFLSSGSGIAALLGGLLGSQSGQQQSGTQTVKTTPWEGQQPYLLDLFSRAQAAAGQPGSSPQTDQILSRMMGYTSNPLSDKAQAVIENGLNQNPANTFGIGMRNPYMGQTTPGTNNGFIGQMTPGTSNGYIGQSTTLGSNPYLGVDNPYLKASIDAASADAMRNLNSQFASADRGSGSFGNSGLGETYARTAANTLGNIATNARMQDYATQQGLVNQNLTTQAGLTQADIARNAGLLQSQGQFNAGLYQSDLGRNAQLMQGQQQFNTGLNQSDLSRNSGLAQQGIQNDIGQYNTGYSNLMNGAFNAPGFSTQGLNNLSSIYNVANQQYQNQWTPLKMYGGLVTGNYGNTQSSPIYTNPYANALGGGLLGSQIYSNLFKPTTSPA